MTQSPNTDHRQSRWSLAVPVAALGIAATLIAGCSSDSSSGESGGESGGGIAAILPGTANDGTANQFTAEGVEEAAKAADVKSNIVERVDQAGAAQSARKLASDGYEVVVAMGSEFQAAIESVAPTFPDAKFIIMYGGETTVPNVVSILPDPEQFGFTAGVAAAQVSAERHAGLISGADGPDFQALVGGFTKGFQSVLPDGEVDTLISGDYADAQKNTEAARSLLDSGVDVLLGNLDSGQSSVVKTAGTAGKYAVGWIGDMHSIAPNAVVTSLITDEKTMVSKTAASALDGTFEGGRLVLMGPKEGVGELGTFGDFVTAEQKATIEASFPKPAA